MTHQCRMGKGLRSVLTCEQVLLHGCVPVLLTHAFHPLAAKRLSLPPSLHMSCMCPRPFETLIDWRRIAVFLHNSQALLMRSEAVEACLQHA